MIQWYHHVFGTEIARSKLVSICFLCNYYYCWLIHWLRSPLERVEREKSIRSYVCIPFVSLWGYENVVIISLVLSADSSRACSALLWIDSPHAKNLPSVELWTHREWICSGRQSISCEIFTIGRRIQITCWCSQWQQEDISTVQFQ